MHLPRCPFPCVGILLLTLLARAGAQVVINEVDVDQRGLDSAEFVELYDGGAGNTVLDGYVLVLYNGRNDSSYQTFDLSGHVTNPRGYFVIGNPGVSNVGLEVDPGGSGAFQNGADAVALYVGSIDAFPNQTAVTPEGLVDALVYGTDDGDDFELLDALTPGEIQVNEIDPTMGPDYSMSRVPDGGEPFASSAYVLQGPSPGFSNVVTEALSLRLGASEVEESAGAQAVEVTVARTGSTEFTATVAISLDDFTEAVAPGEISLPAGQSEAKFFIETVDDAWADGTQMVEIRVSSPGLMDSSTMLAILDDASDTLDVVINEVYPDDRDDANGDEEGALDGPGRDEFVELVNVTDAQIDLSNHTLHDTVAMRHRFPEGTLLEPACAIVVFGGGGVDEGNNPIFGGARVQKANGADEFGLGLNNSGDFVRILNPEGVEVAGLRYEATNGDDGSLVRNPDLTGEFVTHLEVEGGPLYSFSPGYTVEGQPFCQVMLELSLTIDPIMIDENAGESASTLTISRNGPTDAPLLVTLSNSDESEIDIPQRVEIPAGTATVTVPIHAVDDPAQDGDIVVTVIASAPDFLIGRAQIQVLDDADPPAMVVINELDADQPGNDTSEFVELYDGGVGRLPLDGFVVVLFNGAIGESYASYDLAGHLTNENGFFVLGDEAVAQVGLGIPDFALQNGADGVALYRGTGANFPNGSFPSEDDLVDAVIYGTDDDDATDLIDVLTPGQPQVNEGASNNEGSIGRRPDGGDPRISETFSTLTPTPGGPNESVSEESYALWAAGFEGLGHPLADPDGDARANVLEYALGTDPLWAEPSAPLRHGVVGGQFEVAISAMKTFPKDVVLRFEQSSDLLSWEARSSSTEHIEGGLRVLLSESLAEAPTSFIRVVVTVAAP